MATLTTSWQSFASSSFSTGSSTVVFYLEARYTSQSTTNNTTNVQTRLRSDLTSGYINGAGYNFTCTYASTVSGSGVWTFGDEVITSGSKTVTHKSDGTQTISISATAYNKYWNFNKSMSASVSLPKIDRIATVNSCTDFNDETNPTITFTNPAGFQLEPYLNFYVNGVIVVALTRTKGTYTSPYTWTLTDAERNQIRSTITNVSTFNVTEGVYTYSGNTNIGASSKIGRFTFVNANPTFSATYEDTNASIIAITGNNQKLIQNQSTLQINCTDLSAKKDATLSSITTVINGTTYTGTISGTTATFNIGTLDISESTDAVITLTDSRGLTATQTLTLDIEAWSLPTAIINLQRQNNYYSATDINVDATYSSLDGNNTITIQVRDKKTTDANYGAYTTLQDGVTSTLTLDNLYEWDVQVLLTDALGSTTYNLTLGKGMPIVFFDRLNRSMGVNCFPSTTETLELNGYEVALKKDVEKNILTAYLTSDFTIPNTSTLYDLTNMTVAENIGNKLSLSNGKIVIGAGVSKVKVSYTAKTMSSANTTRTFTYLIQDINGTATAISQEGSFYSATGQQFNVSYSPRVISVNQGDAFYLRCYGNKNNTIGGYSGGFMCTIITVEVVE